MSLLSSIVQSRNTEGRQAQERLVQDPAVVNEIQRARDLSREKKFRQAVDIYTKLFQAGSLGPGAHMNYGWDLHRVIKDVLSRSGAEDILPGAIREARQYLSIYMKLEVDRPSLLHTVMLQHALKLGSANHLKVMVFVQMWGLENLRLEDFDRYKAPDDKLYPSVAEKAIQQASKEAAADGEPAQMDYILPFVESAIKRFPDNVWLKYNQVKLLKAAGRTDEARSKAVDFAKAKASEYWTWDLLGDLQIDPALRLACYCKALLCSDDDNFVSGLRLKLARDLADAGHMDQAKGEIVRVVEHKNLVGHKIPAEVGRLQSEPWYNAASSLAPHPAFYTGLSGQADELLFSNIPWMDACIGERFEIEGQVRPRRKLYLRTSPLPTEVSLPESRVPMRNMRDGTTVQVRAELDPNMGHRFTLHAMKPREGGALFDVLAPIIGVVDHVNAPKGVFHCIASQEIQSTFSISEYGREVKAGDNVELKCAVYYSKKGKGVRIISASPSHAEAGANVRKRFSSTVRVDKGMGFTTDGLFVPPDLVDVHKITNDDHVSGIAALNFNKKRNEWGWKAILIQSASKAGE